MTVDTTDEKALVMASSKGLGKAVATELAAGGAHVAIASRSQSNLDAAKEDIISAHDLPTGRIETVVCDLEDEESIVTAVKDAADALGGLTVLVTNHGGPTVETFETSTVDDLDSVFSSVIRSTYIVVDTALPYLLEGDGGAITNVISASAQEPSPSNVLSNVFRPGLYGLSKSLSREYASEGLRVNCVCPRGITTDRIKHKIEQRAERQGITSDEAYTQRTDAVPLGRLGTPEEFAKAVAFISSEDASFVNGATLSVDGGWLHRIF
jgi:3-oxoacyl-[acyl-carrier protein] reductase